MVDDRGFSAREAFGEVPGPFEGRAVEEENPGGSLPVVLVEGDLEERNQRLDFLPLEGTGGKEDRFFPEPFEEQLERDLGAEAVAVGLEVAEDEEGIVFLDEASESFGYR